jgi:glycosyltransferase involved in cell wall biosynthesis
MIGAAVTGSSIDILHVIPFGWPAGGTERSVADLMASQVMNGLAQRVVFLRDSAEGPFSADEVFRPTARDPLRRMIAARRALRPRLVQSWLYPANFAAAVTGPASRAVLVTAERNLGTELSRGRRAGEWIVALAEDASVANSEAGRAAAIERVPRRAASMRVIGPGIADRTPVERVLEWDCVMVGRLAPVKDHESALTAFAALAGEGVLARAVIVGDGPARPAIEAAIAAQGLGDVVVLAGEDDPVPYLEAARVYVSSSRAEGWSRAMLEALRAGVPVVTTAVGGALELPPAVATAVPVADPAALAQAIRGLLGDDDRRRVAGVAARSLFLERFIDVASHGAYRDLYASLGVA